MLSFKPGESRAAFFEEIRVEGQLAAWHDFFKLIEKVLVIRKGCAAAVGTRAVMVLYALQKSVVRNFKLRNPPQWLYLAGEAAFSIAFVKLWSLIGKVGNIPAQGIAEEAGDFIIQVMARGQYGELAFKSGLVEEMPLDFAAGRTDGPLDFFFDSGDGQAFFRQAAHNELQAVGAAKTLNNTARFC